MTAVEEKVAHSSVRPPRDTEPGRGSDSRTRISRKLNQLVADTAGENHHPYQRYHIGGLKSTNLLAQAAGSTCSQHDSGATPRDDDPNQKMRVCPGFVQGSQRLRPPVGQTYATTTPAPPMIALGTPIRNNGCCAERVLTPEPLSHCAGHPTCQWVVVCDGADTASSL